MQLHNGIRVKIRPLSISLKTLNFILIRAVTHINWSMSGLVGNDGLWWFSGKRWIMSKLVGDSGYEWSGRDEWVPGSGGV